MLHKTKIEKVSITYSQLLGIDHTQQFSMGGHISAFFNKPSANEKDPTVQQMWQTLKSRSGEIAMACSICGDGSSVFCKCAYGRFARGIKPEHITKFKELKTDDERVAFVRTVR